MEGMFGCSEMVRSGRSTTMEPCMVGEEFINIEINSMSKARKFHDD